jgi:hypothetical protein
MLEVDDLVIIVLEIFLAEVVNNGFAVLLLLMGAFMPGDKAVSDEK